MLSIPVQATFKANSGNSPVGLALPLRIYLVPERDAGV